MFVYPEYGQTDFIQEFEEDCSLGAMLQSMFEEQPPWDEESKVGLFSSNFQLIKNFSIK